MFMNFRKVNNITGWVILLIALATYTLTREATASFWDCGEFIACANELGVPHPPGSPLFSMLGRLFILLFSGGDAANAASAVNLLSATASGFTILFLFWTITHFARKMFVNHGENLTQQQTFTVIASGVVGALAYTFSDTFWFSAVEGEVYALSSFFTALIIWSMLKWEHAYEVAKDVVERNRADRWIVFIFFMIGLSITVHLLNLLTVPAVVMIYFYKIYQPTVKKALLAFLISMALTGMILWGMVYFIPKASASFDRLFVNSFGLPFFSGFTFFFILLGVLCWVLLWVAKKYRYSFLRLAVWSFLFVLLGYSTYVTTLIRSNANPGIDMSNVDNPVALASYFARDQYGSAPILKGPHFGAYPIDDIQKVKWAKSPTERKYIEAGHDVDYKFSEEDEMIFPRIYDWTDQQDHVKAYVSWLGKRAVGQDRQTGKIIYDPPITYSDNIRFFFSYQMGLMYWRYFMWNFSGRQNDLQNLTGNPRDGNWQTGISFIDNQMLGDQSKLPTTLKENKANNKLFLLPFLFGIIGCVYQFIKKKNDWIVNFLLFFFTGIAIGLYLNMPGNQPRERDYAFVGSFYAFAIWIGLAVTALVKLTKEIKQVSFNTLVLGSILTFAISAFSLVYINSGATVIIVSLMIAIVYAALAAGLPALLKAVSSKGTNEKLINIVAAAVCMLAPILMVSQEWDDHDRSKKTLARDTAINYLESCPQNAILFCFGDNDTYPLWYAQEVEQIRPDIRIINTSLLGIDWYINQLRYKINKSDSIDVIWSPLQIMGDNLQQLRQNTDERAGNLTFDLYSVMSKLGNQENPQFIQVKNLEVPVDTVLVKQNGTVGPNEVVPAKMTFTLPDRTSLQRDDLIILNIIATNKWKRPICFTSPQVGMGLQNNLRKEGLTYRLTPITQQTNPNGTRPLDTDWMLKVLMTKFKNGNADKKGVYFDETNRLHLSTIQGIRESFAELALDLIAKNRKEEAKMVVMRCDSLVPGDNVPYGMASRYEWHNYTSQSLLQAAYQSGALDIAAKISKQLNKDLNEQADYYAALGDIPKPKLQQVLSEYNSRRYMEQVQQKNYQSSEFITNNLSAKQLQLVDEMSRTFDILGSVTEIESRDNPNAPKDTSSKKPDTSALLNQKPKADSPKKDSPPKTKVKPN
jgi:hypothetical protein